MFKLIHKNISFYNDAKNRCKNFQLKLAKLIVERDSKRKNHKSTAMINKEIADMNHLIKFTENRMLNNKIMATTILDCSMQIYHNTSLQKLGKTALENNDIKNCLQYLFVKSDEE